MPDPSLTPLLRPRSIAVVGASRERGTIGAEIFHNLLEHGFQGVVYPVNPKAEFVQSVLAYPTKERAAEALTLITELGRTDALTLKDAAVVLHTAEGRVEVEQARELSAGQGAVAGGVAGFLLGLALGAVVPATLVGLAGGGALGVFDTGIDNRRLRELGTTLEPGAAALGILVEEADWPLVRERVARLGGDPVVVELSDDALAALHEHAARGAQASEPPGRSSPTAAEPEP